MREIKFRAWDKRHNYFDNELYLDIGTRSIYDQASRTYDTPNIEIELTEVNLEDRYILQQYTGLKDKNGKEIYEGDIFIHGLFAFNDTSKFGEDCWHNLPKGVKEDDISTIIGKHEVKWNFCKLDILKKTIEGNPDVSGVEVIGNIYESPELLDTREVE